MINFWKFTADILWRLAIILIPVIGYEMEKSGVSFVGGISGFISALLIGLYGRYYNEIKLD